MAKKPGKAQGEKPGTPREARLKAALKANIAKRKEQSRARVTRTRKEG